MATLTVNEILQDTIDAFAVEVPFITAMGTDLSTATARKDDTIIAHIASLPSVQSYDATSGYELNAAEASDLLSDVPVVLDQLKHVPVRVKYLTQLASKKNLYKEQVRNQAYVLGKSMVDTALARVVIANFTHVTTEPIANTTLSTLEKVRGELNLVGALSRGRFGLVNTNFAGALGEDARIASGDYYGQKNGNEGYRNFTNVAGFQNIWEYPDLPTTGNLTGFFGDKRALVLASRVPVVDALNDGDAPPIAAFGTVTNPETGFTVLTIKWTKQGTFDRWATIAALYGTHGGAQAGGANTKTDKAGHWVRSAA